MAWSWAATTRRRAVTVAPRAFPGYGLTKSNWAVDYTRILDDTKPTGVPPPLSTYWHAYAPMPPLAPHTNTV